MEESQLEHENKMLKEELVELYKKLKEAKHANNLLFSLVCEYMDDDYLLNDPAKYAKKHLILN